MSLRLSKYLAWVLRHAPHQAGLTLDPAGWASVDAVLRACADAGLPHDRGTLEAVVRDDAKQRYELDGDRIRARQGHSVPVDLELPAQVPPDRLFHGTVARFLPAIRAEGLVAGARHAVHLSADPETASQVGARRGSPVVLTVRARALHEQGARFTRTANGVWLVDHVPPAFLEEPRGGA